MVWGFKGSGFGGLGFQGFGRLRVLDTYVCIYRYKGVYSA